MGFSRLVQLSIFLMVFICLNALHAIADKSSYPSVYTVPVSENLAQYAVFPLDDTQIVDDGTNVTVTYSLPLELTGTPMSVTLKGASSGTTLQGPNAQASCSKTDSLVSCKISYTDLPIDPNAVKQYLTSKYTNADEVGFREQVAGIFSSEPVGIVSFSR